MKNVSSGNSGADANANGGLKEQLIEALPQLRAFAWSKTRSESDADDLVQKTCLKILDSQHLYDTEKPLVPWAITILKNLFMDESRAKKRRGENAHQEDSGLAEDLIAERKVEGNLELENINRLLQQLPDEQREVLVLFGAGNKYGEIAESLDIPRGTVMSRLCRGRQALAKLMNEPVQGVRND
jgi:RNA polymerase sigma factor (sigma-70 family)